MSAGIAVGSRRHHHGLVIGKFYPLHAGHQNLIRSASASCERVTVVVLASSVESIPMDVRAEWIRAEHPGVRVVAGLDDAPVDYGDPHLWTVHVEVIAALVRDPVDAAFSSDGYGAELARRMGAAWEQVDPGRVVMPVSGAAVRADVAGHWWALPTAVREWFCRRVVIVGAESTGTTTLAAALAERYAVPWVAEFGREWSATRTAGPFGPWQTEEFELIAAEHRAQEVAAMRRSPRPLVISDTDILATTVWHERYLGARSSRLESLAAGWRPDLYILTGAEIPFVNDGMRDGEHVRQSMHQRFREVLADAGVRWVEVSGSRRRRLECATRAIEELRTRGWQLANPLPEAGGEA